jgi:hypothetical protein
MSRLLVHVEDAMIARALTGATLDAVSKTNGGQDEHEITQDRRNDRPSNVMSLIV